ncbi:MAG: hypothetical protein ACKOW9_06495 [Candidatus Paceibacterota bacterium]
MRDAYLPDENQLCDHAVALDTDGSLYCERCGTYNLNINDQSGDKEDLSLLRASGNPVQEIDSEEEYSFPDKNDEVWQNLNTFEE